MRGRYVGSSLGRIAMLAVLTVAGLTGAGCTDLAPITEYSKSSARLTDESGVYREMTATIDRRIVYSKDQGTIMKAAGDPFDPAPVVRELNESRTRAEADVVKAETVCKTLVAYMEVLGELADNNLASFDTEVENLANALSKGNYVTENDAAAVKDIASILAKAATDAWRRAELAKLIERCDASIQKAVGALETTVQQGVIANLESERSRTMGFYDQVAQLPRGGSVPTVLWLMDLRQREAMADLDRRKKAASDYLEGLKEVANGHAALRQNVGQLSAKDVLARVQQYANDIDKLRAAFKSFSN